MAVYARKLKSGTRWYIGYRDPNGRWIRKGSWDTKRAATIALAEIRTKMNAGDPVPSLAGDIIIRDYISRYFSYCSKIQTPETVKIDRSRIKTFLEFCAQNNVKYMSQITPGLMARFQEWFLHDHSRRSWNNMLTLIKAMINRAIEWDLLKSNPISSVKKLKIDQSFNYFSEDEIAKIIETADEPLKTGVIILVYTGIRRGELWNLRWRDVNFKSRRIIIRPYEDYTTKNRQTRAVPINPRLYEHLYKRRGKSSEYVYRPYENIHTLRRNFIKVLKKLDLSGTLHDLRHSFASMLAGAGTPIQVIKELLGHSDIKTTMIYSHLLPSALKHATDNLPDLLHNP